MLLLLQTETVILRLEAIPKINPEALLTLKPGTTRLVKAHKDQATLLVVTLTEAVEAVCPAEADTECLAVEAVAVERLAVEDKFSQPRN
jgi:hypothetical protein